MGGNPERGSVSGPHAANRARPKGDARTRRSLPHQGDCSLPVRSEIIQNNRVQRIGLALTRGTTATRTMSNIERLGSEIRVPMEADEDGYIGRECPDETCLGYFKIKPGTGLPGPAPCHCPYCGHTGDHSTFYTQEQIAYAHSVAIRKITDAIHDDLKALEFERKPQGLFGIGVSMKVLASAPHPIQRYREKQLETGVTCDDCTLQFAIYGVFGWCPDCGAHNSLHILTKNLELVRKQLALSEAVEQDLAEYLVRNALEDVVSAFDGFGRELCARKSSDIRFQNIAAARRRVSETFGFDFADQLDPEGWTDICRMFQKRHLLAHKMGVIDKEYVEKANDPAAIAGRRIEVTRDEVSRALGLAEALGQRLFKGLLHPD